MSGLGLGSRSRVTLFGADDEVFASKFKVRVSDKVRVSVGVRVRVNLPFFAQMMRFLRLLIQDRPLLQGAGSGFRVRVRVSVRSKGYGQG